MTAPLAELAEVHDGLVRAGKAWRDRGQALLPRTAADYIERQYALFMAGDLLLRAHAISRRIRERASCSG